MDRIVHGRSRWLFVLMIPLTGGCAETTISATAPAAAAPADSPPGSHFDPASVGAIRGRVHWRDRTPQVATFRSIPNPLTDQAPPPARDWPNPNAPRLDASTAGVASAVVFLRGVDPARARPWDLPPATVELRQQRFAVVQGDETSNVGFVPSGGGFDVVSRDRLFHLVQARGAAFFARTLPEPDRVRTCRVDRPGLVELRSGCGYFWMRAYLFVDHHPYYCRPDAEGRFRLAGVPAGSYELVAWHPSWQVIREERNPDTLRVQQVQFAPPLQAVQRVEVKPGTVVDIDLELPGPTGPTD